MEVCKVRIKLEKLAKRQNSERRNADFWPVSRLGCSDISRNKSFRHYCVHREDYLMRFKENSVEPFRRNTEQS